jgi:LuxR family maltose regulon positive regulatory protein
LHLTRGDCYQAHQALDQVDTLYGSLSHPLSASLAAWRAHVWLQQVMLEDNPDHAMESAVNWAESISKKDQSGENYVLHETIWPTHITLARVRLAEGKISEALTLTEKLRSQLETARARGALIQVLILQSLIQDASGQHSEALKTLLQGLTWGESEGFVRSITDAGIPIHLLLDDVRGEIKLPFHLNRYIFKLQEAIPNTGLPLNNSPQNRPPVHLTTAEMIILQKLSEGYSTAEIARELTVSDNTVKTHISHILDKFQVTRRAQAVHRARELAIVD